MSNPFEGLARVLAVFTRPIGRVPRGTNRQREQTPVPQQEWPDPVPTKPKDSLFICPWCRANKVKSTIEVEAETSITELERRRFYDTKGHYHDHDLNITTRTLRCSEGHPWTDKSGHACWCGWNADAETEVRG